MAANLRTMTPDELNKWRKQPRKCRKCHQQLTNADFDLTTSHGTPLVRSKCRKCISEYYRKHHEEKRKAEGKPRPPGQVEAERDKREQAKLSCTYSVERGIAGWEVRQRIGAGSKVLKTFATEQQAERDVLERLAVGKELAKR